MHILVCHLYFVLHRANAMALLHFQNIALCLSSSVSTNSVMWTGLSHFLSNGRLKVFGKCLDYACNFGSLNKEQDSAPYRNVLLMCCPLRQYVTSAL